MPRNWTSEQLEILTTEYPQKGRRWCATALGKTEGAIRSMASKMGLDARNSEVRATTIAAHGAKLQGRRRLAQSAVMRELHAAGKLRLSEAARARVTAAVTLWANSQHPKGMLGKAHSEDAKQKMSDAQRGRTAPQRGRFKGVKASWRTIGRHHKYFRSAWEANYARVLQAQLEVGLISNWEHEPETFWFEEIRRGQRSYLPDFRVTLLDGSVEYHEVKGWMDAASRTKIDRMGRYHPSVRLVVVDAKEYAKVKKQWASLLEDWE